MNQENSNSENLVPENAVPAACGDDEGVVAPSQNPVPAVPENRPKKPKAEAAWCKPLYFVLAIIVATAMASIPLINRLFDGNEVANIFALLDAMKIGVFGEIYGRTLPLLAFPLVKFFGPTQLALVAVPAIVSIFAAVFLPKFARISAHSTVDFFVTLLLVTTPIWMFCSTKFVAEPLFVAFAWLAGTLLFLCKNSWWNVIFGSIFAGLAIATKPTWILFAILFVLATFFARRRSRKVLPRERISLAKIFAGTLILLRGNGFSRERCFKISRRFSQISQIGVPVNCPRYLAELADSCRFLFYL